MGGRAWTPAEVALLTAEVAKRATNGVPLTMAQWRSVAEAVGTRNGVQCRQKWLDSSMNSEKREWTTDEDRTISIEYKNGLGWTEIAQKHFPGVVGQQVMNRYRSKRFTAERLVAGAEVGGSSERGAAESGDGGSSGRDAASREAADADLRLLCPGAGEKGWRARWVVDKGSWRFVYVSPVRD